MTAKGNYEAFDNCDSIQTLALCIYGEARGEGLDGMLAVASVVVNRAKQTKRDVKLVCLEANQFSCFNPDDPNRAILEQLALNWNEHLQINKHLRSAFWIAKGIMEDYLYSNVGDANHYHTDSISPSWNKKMTMVKKIGRHIFWFDAEYAKRKFSKYK